MERRLIIIQGDLTLLPLKEGAIINPSNSGLILTNRGIGQQISRRAGPLMQQTLHTERSKLKGGRLDPGQVVATDAGQIPTKKLIHIAIVGGRKVTKRLVSRGILNAYDLADEMELPVLGMPPIGPDISKFEFEDFLDVFWRITCEEFSRLEYVNTIYLCLDSNEQFEETTAYIKEHAEELPDGLRVDIQEGGISMDMFSSQLM